MKAVQIKEYGSIDVMEVVNIDKPKAAKGQALVEIYASSVNPVDIGIRSGRLAQAFKIQLPIILGHDLAGIISEIGEDVKGLKTGDKVYGQASIMAGASGAFAEYAATPAGVIAKMPKDLSFAQAAVLPLTGVSAVQALYEHMKLKHGDKILIHGGAGGIGTFAIQIAKHIGAYVATTATGSGLDYVRELDADEVIDYKTQKFDELISGYDFVYDTVGGETYNQSYKTLKKGGLILSMLMQPNAELMKQYGVNAMYQSTKTNREHLDMLTKLVNDGVVSVYIEKTFPLEQIREAFKAKESGDIRGKIAITIKEG